MCLVIFQTGSGIQTFGVAVDWIQCVISMCIHMAVEVVFLNERFPTFIAAVIEFFPDRSLKGHRHDW